MRKISPPTGIRSTDRPARSESYAPTELSRLTRASGRTRKCVVGEALTATDFSNSERGFVDYTVEFVGWL